MSLLSMGCVNGWNVSGDDEAQLDAGSHRGCRLRVTNAHHQPTGDH